MLYMIININQSEMVQNLNAQGTKIKIEKMSTSYGYSTNFYWSVVGINNYNQYYHFRKMHKSSEYAAFHIIKYTCLDKTLLK